MARVDGRETTGMADGKKRGGKKRGGKERDRKEWGGKGNVAGAGTGARPHLHEHWKPEPDDQDYPAARDYLTLVAGKADAEALVAGLRSAPLVHRKAKDLLRAGRLALLGTDDAHVAADLKKVHRGERLSPVLLVRGALVDDVALTVADGYHRICASYHLDENADIPCRMVDPPTGAPGADDGRPGARARQGVAGEAPDGGPA